jgi:hypothetical protein
VEIREGLLLLGIVACVAVALWAGPNVAVAEPAAAVAIVLGAGALAVEVLPRLRRLEPAADPARFERIASMGELFEAGAMGRQTILSTIGALESEVFGSRREPLTLDDEIRLTKAPAKEFREWVDAHLSALERAS